MWPGVIEFFPDKGRAHRRKYWSKGLQTLRTCWRRRLEEVRGSKARGALDALTNLVDGRGSPGADEQYLETGPAPLHHGPDLSWTWMILKRINEEKGKLFGNVVPYECCQQPEAGLSLGR